MDNNFLINIINSNIEKYDDRKPQPKNREIKIYWMQVNPIFLLLTSLHIILMVLSTNIHHLSSIFSYVIV